jgi:hypothetical protein
MNKLSSISILLTLAVTVQCQGLWGGAGLSASDIGDARERIADAGGLDGLPWAVGSGPSASDIGDLRERIADAGGLDGLPWAVGSGPSASDIEDLIDRISDAGGLDVTGPSAPDSDEIKTIVGTSKPKATNADEEAAKTKADEEDAKKVADDIIAKAEEDAKALAEAEKNSATASGSCLAAAAVLAVFLI